MSKLDNHTILGTIWVFGNKLDENGLIIHNKARLVGKGYNQEEGIDYDETFTPIARLKAIRMVLAFACERILNFFKWMWKVLSSMDIIWKKFMLNSYLALKITFIQIMFSNFKRPCMVLNKLVGFGMKD